MNIMNNDNYKRNYKFGALSQNKKKPLLQHRIVEI